MKLIGSTLEKDIKKSLLSSKEEILSLRNGILQKTLLQIKPNLKTAYMLNWIIEQGEDIFKIITDDRTIIDIEVSRVEPNAPPIYEIYDFYQYKKNLRGKSNNLQLMIVLELIEQDLKSNTNLFL